MNLLKAHELQDIRDQSIEIFGDIDGNTLTKSYNCITAEIKLVNIRLVCPITRNALNLTMSNIDNIVLSQSRKHCFLLKIIISQESKATIEMFRNLCNF